MEFRKFLELLKKHKYPLIIIPLAIMIITFLLLKNKPNVYSSKARISAGLVDQTQKSFLDKEDQVENKVNQSFSNLLQMLQLKVVIDQISYQLILNDLTTQNPYRKPSKLLKDLNSSARKHAVEQYSKMYANHQALDISDGDQKGLNKVLKSMGYDYESLRNKIRVYRVENSDFIDMDFESENATLSACVVNALCKEFIAYYTSLTKQNELKALNFVSNLMKQKKDSLDLKTATLMNYKIQNRILNLNDQTKSIYNQLSDFETRLKLAQNQVNSNIGAIESIDNKFNQNEKQYFEGRVSSVNRDIVRSKEKLNALNDEYIRSNFDRSIKIKIDSLRERLSQKINQATDKFITNPLSSKETLVSEKLKLELDLALAQNSIKSLSAEIEKINQKLDSLVPNEAVIQSLESEINVASQEYVEILKKFNQVSIEYNSAIKIKQIEFGAPEEPQPSKKIILIILSGVVSFVIYFIVLFALFYLDDSIKYPTDLEKFTGLKVLGLLPLLKSSTLDIQSLWNNDAINNVDKEFRNLLRSIRFELDGMLNDEKIITITSLKRSEGKTLFALSLASAYQMIGKKVLLIDGNFNNPYITNTTQPEYYIEDYFSDNISMTQNYEKDKLQVLGNKGTDTTLFEINNEDHIKQKLTELKEQFDIIIIEASSLDTLNESKEWIQVSDRVVAMFVTNTTLTHEMKEQIEYLKTLDIKFLGWVLNKATDLSYKVTDSTKYL